MKRSYSGALCGACTEWVRYVELCPVHRFFVCVDCLVAARPVVINPDIATLPDKAEGS